MNDRIKNLKKYTTIDKFHRGLRRSAAEVGIAELPEDFRAAGMPFQERAGNMLSAFLDAEKPVFLPGEKIVFTRTIKDIPDYVTPSEWEEIKKAHFVHEKGEVFNISADYEGILQKGLEARRAEFERLAESSGGEKKIFAESVEKVLAALQRLIGRYADEAERLGLSEEAATLRAVRNDPPKTFRQALQLLRAVHFAIWASGSYHNTLGRIDQYLYPFYKSDIESGGLDRGGAFELLEEFFLACNRDSDLYVGMQQGDNGQSVVLGGRNPEGKSMYNELSEMALKASYELALIDPKINMRVDATPPRNFRDGLAANENRPRIPPVLERRRRNSQPRGKGVRPRRRLRIRRRRLLGVHHPQPCDGHPQHRRRVAHRLRARGVARTGAMPPIMRPSTAV